MKKVTVIFILVLGFVLVGNVFAMQGMCQKIGGMMICEYAINDISTDFGVPGPSFIINDSSDKNKYYLGVADQNGQTMMYHLDWRGSEVFYSPDPQPWCKMLWESDSGRVLKVSVYIPEKFKKTEKDLKNNK